ncbi:DUF368 domain-containing protein [Microbacterium album]|uniref:DUF368 domain-containing protein n=1 Tax=Microbacterium album TaxID=2053191 RepID=A0A917MMZ8_9MICO|nr:DUF368 domain-containing protein [Microbacterium album]GGH50103.1 hypothetical protein GCM10010921_28630 [Microbacterium album]
MTTGLVESPHRFRPVRVALNAVRGALIGLAELIPGVSGGTVALITGVYEQLIEAASHVVSAFKRLIFGPDRIAGFRTEIRRTDWWLVGPVVLGMAAAVLTIAGLVEGLVAANPENARGLFFGLVAVSIIVPLQLLPRLSSRAPARVVGEVVLFLAAAAVAFLLIGFADGGLVADPPLWAVFLAAMVAICALVVPGVSGSFFLLAIGLYSPTLQAVHARDLGYIAVFALGAAVGLVSIVKVVRWLLTRHRRITLIAMAGLMLGSLRALWPWQTSSSGETDGVGVLLPPGDPLAGPVLLALLGAAIVAVLLVVESRLQRSTARPPVSASAES